MKKFKISIFYPIVIGVFLILAIGLTVFRHANIRYVVVHDEKKDYEVLSFNKSVSEILEHCEIELGPNDVVSPGLDEIVNVEDVIDISRSYELTIRDGDNLMTVSTTKHTVREILEENSIVLKDLDIVAPFVDAKISEGVHINITRVWDEYVKEEGIIPYYTEINLVNDLEDDEIKLVQSGENGLKEVTYQIRYENGKMISRNFIAEEIVKDPVSEIKDKGSEELFVTSRGLPFRYSKVIICEATAYDLSYASCAKNPGDPAYGITFSGTQARPGVIAVDPRVIPLGSKVYVESLDSTSDYGFASAEDTGSAIKGNKIDLFINNNKAALRYGRRSVRVYIIEDEIDEDYIKGYGY
ncbi:MAG: G5 domain-containing protein [Clostridiales bacterium]|nr:G5 domain-containing protein [Clostridiales bacterium]